MSLSPQMADRLTSKDIAIKIGRTDRRVQQLIAGACTVEPLPADLDLEVGGRGRYTTAVESFTAWHEQWDAHPNRW